jgi:signal transduction histidine kinase/CheY-like chemotaxis protein
LFPGYFLASGELMYQKQLSLVGFPDEIGSSVSAALKVLEPEWIIVRQGSFSELEHRSGLVIVHESVCKGQNFEAVHNCPVILYKDMQGESIDFTPDYCFAQIRGCEHLLNDLAGEILQIYGHWSKTVKYEKIEAALRESEKCYRSMFSKMPSPTAVFQCVENNGAMTALLMELNIAFQSLFKDVSNDLVGMDLEQLEGVFTQNLKEIIYQVHQNKTTEELEYETLDGRYLLKASIYSPIDSLVVVILQDLTHFQKLVDLEKRLAQSQKLEAIGSLAGGLAHDFSNVLQGVSGFHEILKRKIPASNTKIHKLITEAITGTSRAMELVRRMKSFSKAGESKKEPLKLQTVIKEALKLLRGALPRQIRFEAHISDDCLPVEADALQIHQIMVNLGTNAWHAIGDKQGLLKVFLEPVDAGKFVEMRVQDNGCGMDKDVIQHIFEPFFTTKPDDQGTGMGLSNVYKIAKEHGASLSVDSEPEQGTVFTLRFPVYSQDDTNINITTGMDLPDTLQKIMVVDDERAIADIFKMGLEYYGYQVDSFTEPTVALKCFLKSPNDFALIITDLSMPGLDGLTFSEKISEVSPSLPVILCTGHKDYSFGSKAEELNVTQILFKPVGTVALVETVQSVLSGTYSKDAVEL